MYNLKHCIRYLIHMDFFLSLTLVEANFAKVLTNRFEKLYPPLLFQCNFDNKHLFIKVNQKNIIQTI